MGCGQSKINLYPRRNKNGGKGNSAKKSGAADKETDEEEGSASAGAPSDDGEEEPERAKHLLPLAAHPPPVEISASQQDFFKMLDDKINKGKDYDSSSETEVKVEKERRRILIDQWRSASQSTQSSQASPPTPARRRMPRPISQPADRQSSPGASRRCFRQQHMPDGMSPPPRRAQSAQQDQRHVNGDWMREDKDSPKRPPTGPWKGNPKVATCKKKHEVNENQKDNRDYDQVSTSNQDISQITYNPTFQSHSPAHSAKNQPYIAQIISYPKSQQVTPPSPPKFIAPPEEYQDPQNHIEKLQKQAPSQNVQNAQPIYFIHGNTSPNAPDISQQRQQTAFHLQQYVAMKQAQQQLYNTYLQRGAHTVFPNVEYAPVDMTKAYEHHEEFAQYGHVMRPHSAPTPVGVVRPMAVGYPDASMAQTPIWTAIPPVATMGPWVPGQVPEVQYYPQQQYMQMYRPNSAGSAGTLTRYHKTEPKNVCQSINLVRQKPVGQIVMGPAELTVCTNSSESPSPASVSTDSGVSPGNSAPSSKNSFTTSLKEPPVDKKKTKPFSRPLKTAKSLDNT